MVERLLQTYPNDEDALLVAVKYYTRQKDYTHARECAQKILALNGSEENLVIYTDIIAQQAIEGSNESQQGVDGEAQALLEQAQRLEEQAAALHTELPSEQEKYDQMMNDAEDLRRQAANLDITRAINYLLAKKPITGDASGLIDLQIAKLYLAEDDRENAKDYIWKVVDNCGVLRADSPIREPLMEVVEAYNKVEPAESDPALSAAVQRLMQAQSQGVVASEQGSVNGTMTSFVTSTLKYDRLALLIGKIDTTNYPTVRAYVNVSGEKDKAFGLAGDFEAGDFELFDTQYQIQNFSLVKDEEAKSVSIALVMDHSGSMAAVSYTHLDVYKRQVPTSEYRPGPAVDCPSYEQVCESKKQYAISCRKQQDEQDAVSGRKVIQRHGAVILVQNPPMPPLTQEDVYKRQTQCRPGLLSYRRFRRLF